MNLLWYSYAAMMGPDRMSVAHSMKRSEPLVVIENIETLNLGNKESVFSVTCLLRVKSSDSFLVILMLFSIVSIVIKSIVGTN